MIFCYFAGGSWYSDSSIYTDWTEVGRRGQVGSFDYGQTSYLCFELVTAAVDPL